MPREEIRSDRSTSQAGSEFFNTLQEMSRDWMTRTTAEVELSLKLSKKLTDAHSVPDAVAAYQEWLNDEMGARAEDARLLMSNGQKFMDTTSRFLSSGWTNGSREFETSIFLGQEAPLTPELVDTFLPNLLVA
jgi:hypothetical protein